MATSKTTTPITAKKSYKDGHVAVNIKLKCRGWNSDNALIESSTNITSAQARELAAALIQWADKSDDKVTAKAAAEDRRRKWREREIAAGRLIVMGGRS